jgi:hypothetical protein
MTASDSVMGQYLNCLMWKSALELPNVEVPPMYICVNVFGGSAGVFKVFARLPSRNRLSDAVSTVKPILVRVFAARLVPIATSLAAVELIAARTCIGIVVLLK